MAGNINTAYQDALRERANELPAPRTIAASKADVLSNLAFFFGDPVVPERLRDYSEHHAMTFRAQPRAALLVLTAPLTLLPWCAQISLTRIMVRTRRCKPHATASASAMPLLTPPCCSAAARRSTT